MLQFPNREFFSSILASDADTAINPNGMSTRLANGLMTFFINSKSTFINGPRSLLRNPPNCDFK